jgi:hypothetical protein
VQLVQFHDGDPEDIRVARVGPDGVNLDMHGDVESVYALAIRTTFSAVRPAGPRLARSVFGHWWPALRSPARTGTVFS